ncbi:M23 family metallopeptidase [Litorimonas sp.]|uniref:M23 family metallopeptidase n=1 Tax=Litorimonas sp. TaxID=1892381 RepID=UPI003A84937B
MSESDYQAKTSSKLSALKTGLLIRATAFRDFSHTIIPKQNQMKFLGVAGLVAFSGFFILPDNNTKTVEAAETPSLPISNIDLTRYDLALDEDFASAPVEQMTLTIESGDSLGPLLQDNGLSGNEAYRVTEAFAEVYPPRKVRVGQKFSLYFQDGMLQNLIFRPTVEKTVFVDRQDDSFSAREVSAEFKYETVGVRAKIDNSLYLDATRLGAPDKVVAQFASIYEYSVDFQRDIQPGDEFEMFFEVARDRKGEIIKAGDLLYTSFSPRGKTSSYWLYEDSEGLENFYDLDGKTAKRKLRTTPINGARLSSSFGRRKHPILGYTKMHSGTDFAAPRGTPIMAAGSGIVERANRYGSFGNYIRIRHTDGYKTAYAHMSKFANGVRAGSRVTQDQIIGYVGTTGRSTGPHLHYEVMHHGKKINPSRLSQLDGKPLAKSEMAAFAERRAEIETLRASSEIITPAPELSVMADVAP